MMIFILERTLWSVAEQIFHILNLYVNVSEGVLAFRTAGMTCGAHQRNTGRWLSSEEKIKIQCCIFIRVRL